MSILLTIVGAVVGILCAFAILATFFGMFID